MHLLGCMVMSEIFKVATVDALQPKYWAIVIRMTISCSSLSSLSVSHGTLHNQSEGIMCDPSLVLGCDLSLPLSNSSSYLQLALGKLPPSSVTMLDILLRCTLTEVTLSYLRCTFTNCTTFPILGYNIFIKFWSANFFHSKNL